MTSGVRITLVEGGADDVEAAAETTTLSPAAWERWNGTAVWCSLEGLGDGGPRLRISVNAPHGVLELGEEIALVPSTAVLGWFWRAAGLSSSRPYAPAQFDPAVAIRAVGAWLDGNEPDDEGLPPAVRLRVGWGEEVLRHEVLLASGSTWMLGMRAPLEDGPEVMIGPFSMKQLVLDLSALLALATARD